MKLLIIEDEASLSKSIVEYFSQENFLCELAVSYWEGIEKIDDFEYDCIILDINLPGGSGLQLLKYLREHKNTVGATIYVAQTYGRLSPQQMEGFITSYYEYHFLYITGIKAVESESIQGLSLIKLQFHEGTAMANAMAEVISYGTRARSFMPPGTLPPFVMRYDAGSVPIGQLVFSSETHSLNEIQDLALFKVRPMFAALSGVSAPPHLEVTNERCLLRQILNG